MVQGLGSKRAARIAHMLDATYMTPKDGAPRQEQLE
jgi:hypothetical protein